MILKVMGKPTGLRREQQTVSTDTGAPAASKNNGINSGSDLNTFHNGELKLTFPKAPEMESKCKLLQIFFFFTLLPTMVPLSPGCVFLVGAPLLSK